MNTLQILEKAGSTNEYLQNLYSEKVTEEGMAVATFNQTNGRGQKGNEWLSEPGCNICYSIIFRPEKIPAQNQFLICQTAALAVKSFLDKHIKNVSIKWPNDILWKEKKIAGILIENQLTGRLIKHSIVGIGININQNVFPAEIPDAVSLLQITSLRYDLTKLTKEFHQIVFEALSELNPDKAEDIQRYYLNSLFRRDGFHSYSDKDGTFEARIRAIGAQGNLLLEMEDDSIRSYSFKEVQFSIK